VPFFFSRREVAKATRVAIQLGRPLRQSEAAAAIRPGRLAALPEICSDGEATWALCVAPHRYRELVAAGALPSGSTLRASDVRRVAAMLDAERAEEANR
jgi:hypothetical protein